MRKYQQLLLLAISFLCCMVVLNYKSENNRLKYVLKVVNFFGRNDDLILRRFENYTSEQLDLARPLPVWQAIGEGFHAYAAYWSKNDLAPGGQALAIVVGKSSAVVNFRCSLFSDGGTKGIPGKFHFQRLKDNQEHSNNDFTAYIFFCRLSRDFDQPQAVTFININLKINSQHKLKLRDINKNSTFAITDVTICLDMTAFNRSSSFGRNEKNLLQFFLNHKAAGVEHFLVYNGDEISRAVEIMLRRIKIQLYLLPFNFPFNVANNSDQWRHIIEADCLLRNKKASRYSLVLKGNEFIYPNESFGETRSFINSLKNYTADVTRFELPSFAVCLDPNKKVLIDNFLYDSERKTAAIFLYKSQMSTSTILGTPHSAVLPVSMVMAHRYVDCVHVGIDGLHDWRTSIREGFMHQIQAMRNEINGFV